MIVVVGYASRTGGETEGFWQGGNTIPLGQFSTAYTYSVANGVNRDGSRVVGIGRMSATTFEAFLWEPGPGLIPLADLPGVTSPAGPMPSPRTVPSSLAMAPQIRPAGSQPGGTQEESPHWETSPAAPN